MLKLYSSNRFEILEKTLLEQLERSDAGVFGRDTIIIPSTAIARHLALAMADHAGIGANLTFDYMARWLWRQIGHVVPGVAAQSPFSSFPLAWHIEAIFAESDFLNAHPRLSNYLAGADPVMRFELALRIGALVENYVTLRTDWLGEWLNTRQPAAFETDTDRADAAWQADLWRRLVARLSTGERDPVGAFRERLAEHTAPPGLTTSVHVFAVPSIAPLHLELLSHIARHADIHVYFLNPCREYWADIVDRRTLSRLRAEGRAEGHEEGHRLLASWARQTRAYFRTLIEQWDTWAIDESLYLPSEQPTLLGRLQDSILDLADLVPGAVTLAPNDRSLEIHVAHSLTRELEVLQDYLLFRFADAAATGEPLRPADVLVAVPDLDAAAPLIDAVFSSAPDGARIPFTITGRAPSRQDPVAKALLDLLSIAGSRVTAADLHGLLQQPMIARRFDLDTEAVAQIRDWIESSGIRWGLCGAHRARFDLPASERHTLEDGLDRLFLAYALPADADAPFQERLLPAHGVRDPDADVLGRFAAFAERLEALVDAAATPRDAAGWGEFLQNVVDDFLTPEEAELDDLRDLRRGVAELTAVMSAAAVPTPIPLSVIRTALAQRLDEAAPGGVASGRVTFASMSSLRGLPFRVVCLLGLDDGQFPRPDRRVDFDLMAKHPRPGDRARRDDDRNLFLDALLCAREALYLSYTGRSDRDNSVRPPSVLLAELIEVVVPAVATDPSDAEALKAARRRLIVEHPLQPFSIDAFRVDADPRVRSHHPGFAQALRDSLAAPAPPPAPSSDGEIVVRGDEDDEDDRSGEPGSALFKTPLPPPPAALYDRELDDLSNFYANPCQHLLKTRLGITLERSTEELQTEEPVELNALTRSLLGGRLATAALAGAQPDALEALAEAGIELPDGGLGATALAQELADLQPFVDRWHAHAAEPCLPPDTRQLTVTIDEEVWTLRSAFADLRPSGLVRQRYGRMRGDLLLEAWLQHLLLAATAAPGTAQPTVRLFRDQTVTLTVPEDPKGLLNDLLRLYREGLCRPIHFFPKSSHAYVVNEASLKKARDAWVVTDRNPGGESAHAAYRLALRDVENPLDAEFEALSQRVFAPLCAHATFEAVP